MFTICIVLCLLSSVESFFIKKSKDQQSAQHQQYATYPQTWYPNGQQNYNMQQYANPGNTPQQINNYIFVEREDEIETLATPTMDRVLGIAAGMVNLFSPLLTSRIGGLLGILRLI